MKHIIKRILREQLEGKGENALTPVEITLFKYLNKNKNKYNQKSELISFIKNIMSFFGKNESDARYYYEIYTLNYRPEGDYENITKDTFKNVIDRTPAKITNVNAHEYVGGKIPFKGSNLEGKWDFNDKGDQYYVVLSYNWYPIFLYIKGQWYEVSERYSSSTGKQISKARPSKNQMSGTIIDVTPNEIKQLMHGNSLERIRSNRITNFVNDIKSKIIGIPKLLTVDWTNPKKVRFVINDVVEDNGKIKIIVEIMKAGYIVNGKMDISPEGYNDEFAEKLEEGIEYNIIRNNSNFLDEDNTIFEFIHPNR